MHNVHILPDVASCVRTVQHVQEVCVCVIEYVNVCDVAANGSCI